MAQQNLDGREVIPVYTPHIGDHAPNLRETDHLLSKVKHDRKISLCLSDLHHAFWVAILVAGIVGTVIGSLATMNGLNSLTDTNLRKYELDKLKIESERKQWALEREDHNRTARREHEELERRIEFERQQWALERENHDRAARREHEELERKRSLIAWGDLQPSPVCTRYQTKEYTATLYNVPFGVDPIEECYKRTIEINGHQEKPMLCEDQGMCGRTTGHFVTNNEPSCRPHWAEINYKGCDNNQRLFHSRLDGLINEDNWRAICKTTPGTIWGTWLPGPTTCDDWGERGKVGIWTPGWSCDE